MSRKIRKIIFYLFVIVFLIIGPAIILYAGGWRIDFRRWKPVKVGGVYLKELPDNATVFVNDKLVRGNLISNLLPGTYKVRVEKFGYLAWVKELAVIPAIVTEEPEIVLIPEKINAALIIPGNIADFWFNKGAIVYKNGSQQYFLTNARKLNSRTNLSALFTNLKKNQLKLPGYVPIASVELRENANEWVVKTEKSAYLIDTENLIISLLTKSNDSFYPASGLPAYPQNLSKAPENAKKHQYDPENRQVYFLDQKGINVFTL